MDLESCFKRSLVSPLCSYILSQISENARRNIVQFAQFSFCYSAENVIFHNLCVDIFCGLWYAEYVGAVIGTTPIFAHLQGISDHIVNFHMETFLKMIIIVYLLS